MTAPEGTNGYRELLNRYRLRLADLSQRNRSLKLARISQRYDADLFDLGWAEGKDPATLLEQVVKGRKLTLLKALKGHDEALHTADRRLTRLFRELDFRLGETGAYDLAVGYPFAEGRFRDGTPVRCPLLLFPVKLMRGKTGTTRWALEPSEDGPIFNETFFRSYERFNDTAFPEAVFEQFPETGEGLQVLLNNLFAVLRAQEVAVTFNSELFLRKLEPLRGLLASDFARMPVGEIRLQPHAVLGIFPQADSALQEDYRVLFQTPEAFPLGHLFQQSPAAATDVAALPHVQRFWPLPVDESQQQALLRVAAGADLAIDGPPGTGKSQFIVNAVSQALAQGKRVLVVSQKKAALDVVYTRLGQVGLQPFSFLIHDPQVDRQATYRKLGARLRLLRDMPDSQATALPAFVSAGQLADAGHQQLQAYLQALQQPLPCAYTPLELYTALQQVPADLLFQALPVFNRHTLAESLRKLRALAPYTDLLSPEHPWFGRKSFAGKSAVDMQQLQQAVGALPQRMQQLEALWQAERREDASWLVAEDWQRLQAEITALLTPVVVLQVAEGEMGAVEAMLDTLERQLRRQMASPYRQALQRMGDAQLVQTHALRLRYMALEGQMLSLLNPDWWEVRSQCGILARAAGVPDGGDQEPFWQAIADEVHLRGQLKDLLLQLGQQLPGSGIDPAYWQQELGRFREELKRRVRVMARAGFAGSGQAFEHAENKLRQWLEGLTQKRAQWLAQLSALESWFSAAQLEALTARIQNGLPWQEQVAKMQQALAADSEDLKLLDTQLEALTTEERELMALTQPHWNRTDWPERVQEAYLLQWLGEAERDRPELALVSGRGFAQVTSQFADALQQRRSLAGQAIAAQLSSQQFQLVMEVEARKRSSVTDLSYQLEKQRRLWPLRKLIGLYWDSLLSGLMPCVLATPEAVATLFPMKSGLFDLVIVDEASQCPVEQAVPVLLRGKQAVVAGDEQQLPPMSLFSVRPLDGLETEQEEEEGAAMLQEAESALQLAKRAFPQGMLMRHYRSRSPELIAFSDRHFYQERLQYVPSAVPDAQFLPPIRLINVQGEWAENRNEREAEAIVAEILRLVQEQPEASIGVATFNYLQQEAILDALDARIEQLAAEGLSSLADAIRARRESHEPGAEVPDEPLFVKNIENVQGDERDVILFSIGYAPNAQGVVPARFGWLNQAGGEKRLNVAVSRARRQIVLFTSFEPEQLAVEQTINEGPRLLKAYLQFAKRVSAGEEKPHLPASAAETERLVEALAAEIELMIAGTGLVLKRALGTHALEIPLAVLDAKGSGLLAVLVEGRAFLRARDAQEVFVGREAALASRGWKVVQVHARNWYARRAWQLAEIRTALGL